MNRLRKTWAALVSIWGIPPSAAAIVKDLGLLDRRIQRLDDKHTQAIDELNDANNVLVGRIEEVSRATNVVSERVEELSGQLAKLSEQGPDDPQRGYWRERIHTNKGAITRLETIIKVFFGRELNDLAQSAPVLTVLERLGRLEKREPLVGRVERLTEGFTALEAKVDGINNRLFDSERLCFNRRLTELEAKLQNAQGPAAEADRPLSIAMAHIELLDRKFQELESRLTGDGPNNPMNHIQSVRNANNILVGRIESLGHVIGEVEKTLDATAEGLTKEIEVLRGSLQVTRSETLNRFDKLDEALLKDR